MGQPILLWSFLNLKNRKRHFISYFVIFLFPFYSHFAMTAPFILITLLVYGVYVIIKKRTNSSSFIIGVGALFISYIIANFITIENFLQNNAQTHRDLWKNNYPDIESTIRLIAETILNGQYHAASIFGLPILIIALYSIFKKTSKWKTIFHFIISIVLIAFYYSTYRYITVFFEDSLHLLTTFNFNRFTFFVPFIFYLLLLTFYSDKKINRVLLYSLTWVFCLGNIYFNSELKYSTAKLILPNQSTQLLPSYNSFFSPALFNEITAFIALPQEDYRVVSLGIHPSIAQYNGFYTLDSYQNIYPLEYKFKFRKIIQPELNKNNVLKEYFDNWGSRVYLFSSELQESCYVDCPKYFSETIQELNVDVISLKQMSCKYIFSSVKIINAEQIGLELENMFEDDQSFYQIFLYKI
ncbi:MAG: hypothetical protein HKN75_00425 [Bacteroidia bacterium]|nr:hypothetical protein [Bacteroidia bacterium]